MPPAVAALPRDKRGFPVPWVSEWDPGHWNITMHPRHGAMVGSCDHVDGVGTPHLGNLCAARQVQGMLKRLCDVCGQKIDGFCYFMGSTSLVTDGYRELPVHLECALYAGQVCPGLVTPARQERIAVAECLTYRIEPGRIVAPDDGSGRPDERRFDSLDDPAIRLLNAVGFRSVMTAIYAVPEEPKVWLLNDWLQLHGVEAA